MKTEKVTCVKSKIDGPSKEEMVLQVMDAALELVRSMPEKYREELAVALVIAAIMQDCGAMPEVDAVELCEQCGVRVWCKAEADCKEAGLDAEEEN